MALIRKGTSYKLKSSESRNERKSSDSSVLKNDIAFALAVDCLLNALSGKRKIHKNNGLIPYPAGAENVLIAYRSLNYFIIHPAVGKSLSGIGKYLHFCQVGLDILEKRVKRRAQLRKACALCGIDERGNNLALAPCSADVRVGVRMADTRKNKSLRARQLNRRAVVNRVDGGAVDVFRLILLNLNGKTAERVDNVRERGKVNRNVIVDINFEILFKRINKRLVRAVVIGRIELAISSDTRFIVSSKPSPTPNAKFFPTSSLNTFDGECIPNIFLIPFKTVLPNPFILLRSQDVASLIPFQIPFTKSFPTLATKITPEPRAFTIAVINLGTAFTSEGIALISPNASCTTI